MSIDDRGSLGKSSLELTADTTDFEKNVEEAHGLSDDLKKALEAIAAAGEIAEKGLGRVKFGSGQASEARVSAEAIISGVRGISEESAAAAVELDRVKLTDRQAAESKVAAEGISEGLDQVSRNADQAKRKLEEVRLAGAAESGAGSSSMIGGTSVPLLAGAIGGGALLAPAAGPAILGLLATLPAMLTTAAGAAGTLELAFHGVGAAITGNEKAYDALQPAQQQFVVTVRSLDGLLQHLEQTAGQGLFPGLTAGLHDALSPGTVGMVTTAVTEFAHAIGLAGEEWGRYFGSSEFQQTMGPLLESGAHDIDTMSQVSLHLVDALLQLGRAAIPFTNWLGMITDDGAKWLDQLVKQRDETGQLGSALHEAETSLTLVGRLVEALGSALGSLGDALYPVSKVAVKDLTSGLNDLAGVFDHNKQTIRELLDGGLSALVDVIHAAWSAATVFASTLRDVAGAIDSLAGPVLTAHNAIWQLGLVFAGVKIAGIVSGWMTSLQQAGQQAVISSQMAQGASRAEAETYVASMSTMEVATEGLSATIDSALISTGIGAVVVAVGLLTGIMVTHWSQAEALIVGATRAAWDGVKGIVEISIYGILAGFDLMLKAVANVVGHIPFIGSSVKNSLDEAAGFIDQFRTDGLKNFAAAGAAMGEAWGQAFDPKIQAALRKTGIAVVGPSGSMLSPKNGGTGVPYDSGTNVGPINLGAGPPKGQKAGMKKMLDFATSAIGDPYLWGGSNPSGFDCSGLVMWAFANGLNIQLPHSTYQQAKMGAQVNPSRAKVGDVVFTNYGEGGKGGPGHEGLIVGMTKSGQPIIEAAPHTGANVQDYYGYGDFTGGARYTVRDLRAKPAPNPSDIWGAPPAWSTPTTAKAYKVPVALTDRISKDWAKFKGDTTKQNLDTYDAAVMAAEKLSKQHGASIAPYVADISKAKTLFQKKLAAAQVAAAKQTISQLSDQTAGPEQALKVAQAASASPQIVLAAQQALLTAYQTEAAELKSKLDASSGKAKAAYKQALAKVNSAISSTEDSVVSTLQGIAQTAQQNESTYASRVEQDVISQFEQQTQDYITNVLGPEYYQGTDANGAPLQTPAEAQLSAMQAEDTQTSLTDSLASAQQQLTTDQGSGASAQQLATDQEAITQAQRQIQENQLSIQATQERQQADAQYAAAVQNWQQQRSVAESQLSDDLDNWAAGLATGTTNLSDLNGIAAEFGLTLSGPGGVNDSTSQIGYDFSLLSTASNAAAAALAELAEIAAATTGGSSFAAASAANILPSIYAALHGSTPIAMAAGGVGRVTMPTLFLAGEAGAEEFAFSGGGRSFNRLANTQTATSDVVLVAGDSGRELARAVGAGLGVDRQAAHIVAKNVKPALARVASI